MCFVSHFLCLCLEYLGHQQNLIFYLISFPLDDYSYIILTIFSISMLYKSSDSASPCISSVMSSKFSDKVFRVLTSQIALIDVSSKLIHFQLFKLVKLIIVTRYYGVKLGKGSNLEYAFVLKIFIVPTPILCSWFLCFMMLYIILTCASQC